MPHHILRTPEATQWLSFQNNAENSYSKGIVQNGLGLVVFGCDSLCFSPCSNHNLDKLFLRSIFFSYNALFTVLHFFAPCPRSTTTCIIDREASAATSRVLLQLPSLPYLRFPLLHPRILMPVILVSHPHHLIRNINYVYMYVCVSGPYQRGTKIIAEAFLSLPLPLSWLGLVWLSPPSPPPAPSPSFPFPPSLSALFSGPNSPIDSWCGGHCMESNWKQYCETSPIFILYLMAFD